MNRTLLGLGLVFVLIAVLGVVLMWYLALGSTGLRDQTIVNSNVSERAIVAVGDGIELEAANEAEAYYLLGYGQGFDHAWTLCLLRQTALGRLSEWFDQPTIAIDRLTRSLGIASGARTASGGLPADDRRLLGAFARGVSDAFQNRAVVFNEQLVLLDITPEPWEDWHSIAVERLFAWLSEPPGRPAPGDTALAALRAFQQADETLRQWLHLHGFEHSTAWSIDDSSGTVTQAQFVYGATALAHFVPVRMSWPGVRVDAVSLLGTPILPFSTGSGGTNVTLLSSPRLITNRFAAGFPDSVASEVRHDRIVLASGGEHLVTIPHLEGHLFFSSSSLLTDLPSTSFWGTLTWAGLEPLSDWPAWRQVTLASAGVESYGDAGFELFDGVGLRVDPQGGKQTRGRPVVEGRAGSSVFVAIHPLSRYAAQRFGLLADLQSADILTTDVTSTWAEANVAVALGALGADSTFSAPVREAVDYLKNWDYRYNMASIGAPIFDAWMGAYTGHSDPFPTVQIIGDSLEKVQTAWRLQNALETAVDSLLGVAGSDLARWRLESFRTSERYSPVWSYDAPNDRRPAVDPRRYAPLLIQQPGHPTTLAWESGLFDYPRNSPAHVVARVTTSGDRTFSFRPDYTIGKGLIARHVVIVPGERPTIFPSRNDKVRLTFRPSN